MANDTENIFQKRAGVISSFFSVTRKKNRLRINPRLFFCHFLKIHYFNLGKSLFGFNFIVLEKKRYEKN